MDILAKIKEVCANLLGVSPDEVTMEAAFVDDLGADSLDLVELVMELEEQFGVEIPEEDVSRIRTVGDAVQYIKSKS